MTTYLLTAGNDTITGTADADTFEGNLPRRIGGTDTLNGEGGNDKFILGEYQFLIGGDNKKTTLTLTAEKAMIRSFFIKDMTQITSYLRRMLRILKSQQ